MNCKKARSLLPLLVRGDLSSKKNEGLKKAPSILSWLSARAALLRLISKESKRMAKERPGFMERG